MSFKNRPSSRVSVFLSAGSGFEAVSAISKTLHNLPSHTLTHTHADAHKRRNASTLASPHAHTNLPSLFPLCFKLRFSLSRFTCTKPTHASLTHPQEHITHLVSFWMRAHIFALWREHLPRCFVVSESVWEHTLEPELWVVGGKQM